MMPLMSNTNRMRIALSGYCLVQVCTWSAGMPCDYYCCYTIYVCDDTLQEELEALFVQLDKAKGRATGTLGKGELGDALKAFFRVGQPGGKTEERHDELMQVCSSTTPLPPLPPPRLLFISFGRRCNMTSSCSCVQASPPARPPSPTTPPPHLLYKLRPKEQHDKCMQLCSSTHVPFTCDRS